jgi:hypothetical protein
MIDVIAIAAAGFVVLHRADGGSVVINPAQVTSLRNPVGTKYRQLIPTGNCAVDLTDRKFVMVMESCAEVKRLLESVQ